MLIQDANGKEFNVELQDFMHFTTDAEIEKGKGFGLADSEKTNTDFKVSIVDSQNNEVDVKTLLDAKENNAPITCIDVTFEATHSGRNRNYSIYHSDSMEKDAESWMNPFARPFIKNHNTSSEPLGRVKNYSFGQSDFNPDRDCINVTYRVTDIDAIPKFLDGRYKTMSIGGNVKNITCGICGKAILKDNKVNFCGHWKGETYKDQVCLWNCRDIEYVEGSVVNTPADDWAMVKHITINPQDSSGTDSTQSKANTDGEDLTNMEGTVLDKIDDLTKPEEVAVEDKVVTEEETITTTIDSSTIETGILDTKVLEDKIKDLETKVSEHLEIITQRDSDLEAKTNEITGLNDKVTTLEKDLTDMKKAAKDLAILNKELLAQRIIDFGLFNLTVTDEDVESKKEGLLLKTAKELNDMGAELKIEKKTITQVTTATNPGLANTNDGVTVVDNNINDNNQDKKETLTLKDLEESVINVFTRPNGYKKEEI